MKRFLPLIILLLNFLNSNAQSIDTLSGISNAQQSAIRTQIQKMLIWADTTMFPVLPFQYDESEAIAIGIDSLLLEKNIIAIKESGFFADTFIQNYRKNIKLLNNQIKQGAIPEYLIGEQSRYTLLSGVNPWCLCQDNLEWNRVDVKILNVNKEIVDLYWYWGKLPNGFHPSWKEFTYKVQMKEKGQEWLITYLEGFDLKRIVYKTTK